MAQKIPGLQEDTTFALLETIRKLEERIALLEKVPTAPDTQRTNFKAVEGQFIPVEAGPEGLTCLLPKARSQNRSRKITLYAKNANPILIQAIDGLVNNNRTVLSNAPGTIEAISDGETGWSLSQTLTVTGVIGAPGTAGSAGVRGFQGAPGEQAEPGIDGQPGVPGQKGDKGDAGVPGQQGDAGVDGSDGAPGLKGDKGDQGPPGAQGLDANDGADGSPGAKGDKGDKGDQGPPGDQGEKGDQGDPGPAGSAGTAGAAGGSLPFTAVTEAGAGPFNDYVLPDLTANDVTLVVTGAGTRVFTGFVSGSGSNVDGMKFRIQASTSPTMVEFNHLSGSSAPANTVATPREDTFRLQARELIELQYRGGDWRIQERGLVQAHVQFFTTAGLTSNLALDPETDTLRVDTGNAAWSIDGIAGGYAGRRLRIENAANTAATGTIVTNGSSASSAANQIITPFNVNRSAMRYSCDLEYDGVDSFWRVISETACSPFSDETSDSFGLQLQRDASGWLKQSFIQLGTATGLPSSGDIRKGTAADLSLAAAANLQLNGDEIQVNDTAGTGQGFLKIQEGGAIRTATAGKGMLWVQNLTPCALYFSDDTNLGDWPLNVHGMAAQTVLQTVSAGTGTISAPGSTIPAGTLRVGSCYKLEMMGVFVRGATATALSLQFDLMINGVAVRTRSVGTNTAAASYGFHCMALVNITAIGAAGTFQANLIATQDQSATGGSGSVASTAIDTTVNRLIQLRCNMSAIVASTSINVTNSFIQKIG